MPVAAPTASNVVPIATINSTKNPMGGSLSEELFGRSGSGLCIRKSDRCHHRTLPYPPPGSETGRVRTEDSTRRRRRQLHDSRRAGVAAVAARRRDLQRLERDERRFEVECGL